MVSVAALPNIQILSPQNTTYDSNKILLNVTSNETVDFFIKNERTGEKQILEENTTNLETNLYVNKGNHKLTVWANNSNGEINESINFNSSKSNPINITSCGILYSSDTEYILANDISTTNRACLELAGLRNVSLDLNQNRVSPGSRTGIRIIYSSDIQVYNGEISGSPTPTSNAFPFMLYIIGTKLKFENLTLDGFTGIRTYDTSSVIFRNVSINSSLGIWYDDITEFYFINSSFKWNGKSPFSWWRPPFGVAILDNSGHSNLVLENVTIENFPYYDFYLQGSFSDIFLRNTEVNMSKVYYPNWVADTRFFEQHLIILNISDQFNESGACSVRILDNGVLPRVEGETALFSTLSNPTAKQFVPTGETGEGEVWLTEKLTLARSSSPPTITEYDFSPYNLTTRAWGSENYSNIQLNLTDHNSTIYVDFKINAATSEELPECTITQMLDLNNDETINIQDAVIILRKIAGLQVSIAEESKECVGINLNPF
jgi:hypothetical protein